jgi:CBS domain-containing protein
VLDSGHPVGILTRSDVLEFLTQAQSQARPAE